MAIEIKSEIAVSMYFITGLYTFITFVFYIFDYGFDFFWLFNFYFGDGEFRGFIGIMLLVFAVGCHLYEARYNRDESEKYYDKELSRLKSEVASLKRKKTSKRK